MKIEVFVHRIMQHVLRHPVRPQSDAPCRWCNRPRSEHGRSVGRLIPRTACLGLTSRYEPLTEPGLLR